MKIETVNISLQPEALQLIQYALGHLAIDLEESEEILVSDTVDASMKENIQGLYVHIGEILSSIS
jgi:hypothetical protein